MTHEKSTWISDGLRMRRDPGSYAIVRDLAIVLVHTVEFGTQMRWQRTTGEVLVEFPWWDHLESDANRWPESWPPIGTLDTPFFDADQAWWFSAWQDGGFVFVETGTDLSVATASFRVAVSDFMAAWADGIRSLPRK